MENFLVHRKKARDFNSREEKIEQRTREIRVNTFETNEKTIFFFFASGDVSSSSRLLHGATELSNLIEDNE